MREKEKKEKRKGKKKQNKGLINRGKMASYGTPGFACRLVTRAKLLRVVCFTLGFNGLELIKWDIHLPQSSACGLLYSAASVCTTSSHMDGVYYVRLIRYI